MHIVYIRRWRCIEGGYFALCQVMPDWGAWSLTMQSRRIKSALAKNKYTTQRWLQPIDWNECAPRKPRNCHPRACTYLCWRVNIICGISCFKSQNVYRSCIIGAQRMTSAIRIRIVRYTTRPKESLHVSTIVQSYRNSQSQIVALLPQWRLATWYALMRILKTAGRRTSLQLSYNLLDNMMMDSSLPGNSQ